MKMSDCIYYMKVCFFLNDFHVSFLYVKISGGLWAWPPGRN